MSAPLRITNPTPARGDLEGPGRGGGDADSPIKEYLGRLMKLIPGEAVSLYLVGAGVIPWKAGDAAAATPNGVLVGWSAFCLFATFLVRMYGTSDANAAPPVPPEWKAVGVSMIAFVIWVYTLGGPFTLVAGLHQPYLGSLAVLAWTFVVPFIYMKLPPR